MPPAYLQFDVAETDLAAARACDHGIDMGK
jgi:hypothetical protein